MARAEIAGRSVVITGASSGFGKGTALELARSGANLILAARRDALLDQLAHECESAGGSALAVPTDVGVRGEVEKLAQAALGRFGRIDVWINNAGVGAIGRFEAIPLAAHVKVIETDLMGTLYGSYYAYRQFLTQGSGTLINVSSELGKHTVPYYTSYAAAKHGIVGLCESLRQEIEQNDIEDVHVCLVLPTAHDTPFFDHVANYTGHATEAPKPLHDPQNVVDVLVGLVSNPKDQKIVGGDGIAKVLLKSLAPAAAEKLTAKVMHQTQFDKAPAGADTPGSVLRPTARGTEVKAGRTEQRH